MSFSIYKPNNQEIINEVNYKIKSGTTVINRGNPGNSTPSLLLDDFNTIHKYSYSSAEPLYYMAIATGMVEDAVYEVNFSCSGSTSSNNDMLFVPNFDVLNSHFYSIYQNMVMEEGIYMTYNTSMTSDGFYFDFVNGSYGYDPVGKITIHNNRFAKKVKIEASDTSSMLTGSGYWLNSSDESANYGIQSTNSPLYDTTTIWSSVGNLSFGTPNFQHFTASVRRIA